MPNPKFTTVPMIDLLARRRCASAVMFAKRKVTVEGTATQTTLSASVGSGFSVITKTAAPIAATVQVAETSHLEMRDIVGRTVLLEDMHIDMRLGFWGWAVP